MNMITLVHGNDIAASRNFYIEERQKYKEFEVLEGKNLEFAHLFQKLEGNSLFSTEINIFVENFFSNLKSTSTEYKKVVEYLNKKKDVSIFFWEDKELTKAQVGNFKNATVKLFNYPQLLFTFLDAIKPHNPLVVKLFADLQKNMEAELIFYMIVRQFRLMLTVLSVGSTNIDDAKRLAPWQMSRLKSQANLFGKEKLTKIYNKLYKMDYESKYGLSSLNLAKAIDIFLLDL